MPSTELDRLVAQIMSAYDMAHLGLTRASRVRREKFEDRVRAVLKPLVADRERR